MVKVRPEETVMVAAHAYDLRGAKEVGMRTVYVERWTDDVKEDKEGLVRGEVDEYLEGDGWVGGGHCEDGRVAGMGGRMEWRGSSVWQSCIPVLLLDSLDHKSSFNLLPPDVYITEPFYTLRVLALWLPDICITEPLDDQARTSRVLEPSLHLPLICDLPQPS